MGREEEDLIEKYRESIQKDEERKQFARMKITKLETHRVTRINEYKMTLFSHEGEMDEKPQDEKAHARETRRMIKALRKKHRESQLIEMEKEEELKEEEKKEEDDDDEDDDEDDDDEEEDDDKKKKKKKGKKSKKKKKAKKG